MQTQFRRKPDLDTHSCVYALLGLALQQPFLNFFSRNSYVRFITVDVLTDFFFLFCWLMRVSCLSHLFKNVEVPVFGVRERELLDGRRGHWFKMPENKTWKQFHPRVIELPDTFFNVDFKYKPKGIKPKTDGASNIQESARFIMELKFHVKQASIKH